MALPEAPDTGDLNHFKMGVWVCASGKADKCRDSSDIGPCVFGDLDGSVLTAIHEKTVDWCTV